MNSIVTLGLFILLQKSDLNQNSAGATAQATLTVTTMLQVKTVSDLNFGTSSAGEQSKIIPAGTVDNPENASFIVQGEPNKAYNVILPSDDAVIMKTDDEGTNASISVYNFTSNTQSGNYQTGSEGKQFLFVGATHAPLKLNQIAGSYRAVFTVTIGYE